MFGVPVFPGSCYERTGFEGEICISQSASGRLAGELIPQGVGCFVEHQFVGSVE